MRKLFAWMGSRWCRAMHRRALWPIHGKYVCATCRREHKAEWEMVNPRFAGMPKPMVAVEGEAPKLRPAVVRRKAI